jgi:hypothetical protein
MKKFIPICFLFLALTVTACGNSSTLSPDSTSPVSSHTYDELDEVIETQEDAHEHEAGTAPHRH